jgi:uncharacterized small protein (DUF1192 family)
MNKKRGPVSYSTYQEAKDRIKELEAKIDADDCELLEANENQRQRISLLEAAIRRHKACGGEPVDSERLYAVLQEDKP